MCRVKKPRVALKYLSLSLELEKNCPEATVAELASSYLNLSAIYSELDQHAEAIDRSIKSIMLIRNYLQKMRYEDQEVNDLGQVLSKTDENSKGLKFLHKSRTGLDSTVLRLSQDLCGDDELEHEILKVDV